MSGISERLRLLLAECRERPDASRTALCELVYDRLKRIASKILNESFPRLRNAHDVTSIVNDAWLKFESALSEVELRSEADFSRFAAFKIRQVLLTLTEKAAHNARIENLAGPGDTSSDSRDPAAPTHTDDPAELAMWTEFHRQVETLPEDERTAFELSFYLGLSKSEIARLTNRDRRAVSETLIRARQRIIPYLPVSASIEPKARD